MVGASSMKELGHDNTMLLLSDTPDAWRAAGPVTKVSDMPYPFDKSRPTAKEVSPRNGSTNFMFLFSCSLMMCTILL